MMIRKDDRLAVADRKKRSDHYAAQAVQWLEKSRDCGGFQNAAELDDLKRRKEFTSLAPREDFNHLLARLEADLKKDAGK
jgi:hypothetical protein